jgi:hypothetical protein
VLADTKRDRALLRAHSETLRASFSDPGARGDRPPVVGNRPGWRPARTRLSPSSGGSCPPST